MNIFDKPRNRYAGYVAGAAFLTICCLWGFIIRPMQNHIKTAVSHLNETKRKIELSQRAINNLDRVNVDLEDSNQRLKKKESLGVGSGDIYLWMVNLLLDL
jgi:hypothetical protein